MMPRLTGMEPLDVPEADDETTTKDEGKTEGEEMAVDTENIA